METRNLVISFGSGRTASPRVMPHMFTVAAVPAGMKWSPKMASLAQDRSWLGRCMFRVPLTMDRRYRSFGRSGQRPAGRADGSVDLGHCVGAS
ncbi:hypothetical protein NL676_030329 [Syzygium grande]|nr:hypothetical protein NL676_030329 [Syzygium grande]